MSNLRAWLEVAEGPLFRFALVFMVLGLIRLVILSFINLHRMKAGTLDKSSNLAVLLRANLKWLSLAKWLQQDRAFYTAMSAIFHMGLIVVPIFFLPHLRLWLPGQSAEWFPALSFPVADGLTALTVITGIALVVMRAGNRGSRALSRFQDWTLTPLCVVIFLTGFLAVHQTLSPVPYLYLRLTHVLAGDLLFVLMPFTKLAHVVLLPFTNALSDLSWKLVPGVGAKVRARLGHESRPV